MSRPIQLLIRTAALALGAALALSGCRDGVSLGSESVPVVQLATHSATISAGDSLHLIVLQMLPPGRVPALTWTSSDATVASVTGGLVRGLKPGRVTITAVGEGARDSAIITVDSLVLTPVRGSVFQRQGAKAVAGAVVTVRSFSGPGCSGAEVRRRTTLVGTDGAFALGIPLPARMAPGGDCVEVSVLPPENSGLAVRYNLAPDTLRLVWGTDVIPAVLFFTALFDLQFASPWDPPTGTRSWRAVSAGSTHTCAIASDGQPLCWGGNRWGQLGAVTPAASAFTCYDFSVPSGVPCASEPLALPGVLPLAGISAGYGFSCALASAGQLLCWGDGIAPNPAIVAPPAPLVAFARSCGLDGAGRMFCWPNGASPLRETAALVAGVPPFTRIAVSGTYCGLDAGGHAWCWGYDRNGETGHGRFGGLESPAPVAGAATYGEISIGGSTTCALTSAGAAWCWGMDDRGQVGAGSISEEHCPSNPSWIPACSTRPTAVVGGLAFKAISVGGQHVCALTGDGRIYCWGDNSAGQLGVGARDDRTHPAPEAVAGTLRFSSLSAGDDHTCAIATSGGLYCWGQDRYGQLGGGWLVDRARPTLVSFSAP